MKLVIIQGPPAAGKLTVATELAAPTSFKLFHNHASIDCVKPVFEFATPPERYDLLSPLPGRETLIIDTSDTLPCEAASRIIEHYGLHIGGI